MSKNCRHTMLKYDILSTMEFIRRHILHEEFDYQTLLHGLGQYSRPRDKISDLLRKGVIIRVKKGIYIFGEDYRRRPYSREILANLIYGPSYISLEYALHYFGLIPERVEAVTSVTTGRSRRYATPIGLFRYRMIPLPAFRILGHFRHRDMLQINSRFMHPNLPPSRIPKTATAASDGRLFIRFQSKTNHRFTSTGTRCSD